MHEYMIIALFCDVDNFYKIFEFKLNDNLLKIKGKRFSNSILLLSKYYLTTSYQNKRLKNFNFHIEIHFFIPIN
jgi:hypothetical protein